MHRPSLISTICWKNLHMNCSRSHLVNLSSKQDPSMMHGTCSMHKLEFHQVVFEALKYFRICPSVTHISHFLVPSINIILVCLISFYAYSCFVIHIRRIFFFFFLNWLKHKKVYKICHWTMKEAIQFQRQLY